MRAQVAQALTGWSHARFNAEIANIDRLLECSDLRAAHTAAQRLLERCLAAGDVAYQGTAYDIASAYWYLGKTLRLRGAAEAALQPLTEAQQRFQTLAEVGNTGASHMVAAAISERGDCLLALGRLDEAAHEHEDVIQRAEQLDDRRMIAVTKGQLGTVRRRQQRYKEALAAYQEAMQLFGAVGEPGSVAIAWHQIGMICRSTRQFERAELAYRQALAIWVQQQNRTGEAGSLNELGTLYNVMERHAEAAAFYRQAADISITLGDLRNEGLVRSNLADTLMALHRYDDARQSGQRARLNASSPLATLPNPGRPGHCCTISNRPLATPQPRLTPGSKQYSAIWRTAAGENHAPGARLFTLIAHAIRQGDTTEVTQFLAQLAAAADTPARIKAILPQLHAILHGDRAPALTADPALDYGDAAELLLLLEMLEVGEGKASRAQPPALSTTRRNTEVRILATAKRGSVPVSGTFPFWTHKSLCFEPYPAAKFGLYPLQGHHLHLGRLKI